MILFKSKDDLERQVRENYKECFNIQPFKRPDFFVAHFFAYKDYLGEHYFMHHVRPEEWEKTGERHKKTGWETYRRKE